MAAELPIDVATRAERLGYSIVEASVGGETVWAVRRDSGVEWPHFATRAEACIWMEEQLCRSPGTDHREAARAGHAPRWTHGRLRSVAARCLARRL